MWCPHPLRLESGCEKTQKIFNFEHVVCLLSGQWTMWTLWLPGDTGLVFADTYKCSTGNLHRVQTHQLITSPLSSHGDTRTEHRAYFYLLSLVIHCHRHSRSSSYIKLEGRTVKGSKHFMFVLFLIHHQPILFNPHYLNVL